MNTIGQQPDRLGVTLLVAAAFHAFVILGITFNPFDRGRPDFRQQSLEIMVVNQPVEAPPEDEKTDFLAQTSQQGSGEEREPVKPQLEQIPEPMPLPQQIQPSPPQPPKKESPLLTTQISPVKTEIEPPPEMASQLSASQLLASKNMEIARLTAELQRKTQAYAKMPKRKAISASTKEYKYAAYLDAWRRKVERIGNLNYPDQAKRDRLYGNLVLHVAVKSDGSVERIRVLHSSGHKILDDAAMRIVRMSAPFSPFPVEISKETDILDITRTWQFLRSGRLGSE
ncbi:MAG: energy transducer TonB [Candidatus Thiodiazotropha sp. (ex Gloverina cf. vestifex)]|nr:energy transducer TonB [Candidatus Thiodiazotropha sp. (ex Gloverina cf. vestifex)]